MDQVNLRLEQCGCWPSPTPTPTTGARRRRSCDRAGCEFWMHPNHTAPAREPVGPDRRAGAAAGGRAPERRARRRADASYAERAKDMPSGIAARDRARPGARRRGRDRHRPRHLAGLRDPGHTPVARLPVPARAPAADLRRSRAGPDLAVLRLRLHARSGGRVPGSLDRVERLDARLALSGHGKPFLDVPGHIEGNRKLVRERIEATLTALSRPSPGRRSRSRPDIYGEPLSSRNANWLLTADALLPAPPRAGGSRVQTRAARRGERSGRLRATSGPARVAQTMASTADARVNLDTIVSRLVELPRMRIDRDHRRGRRAALLVRVLPAQDRRRRAGPAGRAGVAAASSSPTSCRSPTAPAARTRDRTLELTKWIKQELGIEAMAHLSCVGATRDELRDDPRRHERRRDRERAGAARRPARAARPTGRPTRAA